MLYQQVYTFTLECAIHSTNTTTTKYHRMIRRIKDEWRCWYVADWKDRVRELAKRLVAASENLNLITSSIHQYSYTYITHIQSHKWFSLNPNLLWQTCPIFKISHPHFCLLYSMFCLPVTQGQPNRCWGSPTVKLSVDCHENISLLEKANTVGHLCRWRLGDLATTFSVLAVKEKSLLSGVAAPPCWIFSQFVKDGLIYSCALQS